MTVYFELFVYDDHTSRLSEFQDQRYVGTEYLDGRQTALVLLALRSKGEVLECCIDQMNRWVARLTPKDRQRWAVRLVPKDRRHRARKEGR